MTIGKHVSLWLDNSDELSFDSLNRDIEVDVIVVGGGIAGLSIATLLKKEGLNVCVLEARRIGHYITSSSTAKLSYTSTLIYSHIISTFGKEFGLKFKEAYFNGFNKIKDIIDDLNIDCDLREVSFYILSEDETKNGILDNELDALNELDIPGKIVNNVPYPFENVGRALVHENQLELNPIKYLHGLSRYVDGDGSFIFENSRVLNVENLEEFKIAKTKNGIIKGKNIVIATNTPIYDPDSVYKHLNQNKSHSLGLLLKKNIKDMFVVFNPFHTLRSTPTRKGEMSIILGEHHSIEDPTNRFEFYKNLRRFSDDLLDVESFEYFYSGGDNLTEDRLSIIGETSEKGTYLTTGFNSWGMNTGMVSGIIIKDLILGKSSNYLDIFSPLRFKNKKYKIENERIEKFKNMNIEYTDSITKTILEMNNDESRIINCELGILAIYKDNDSNTYVLNGKCSHKGCILHWDNVEKIWECPCHGSIFDYKGNVIRAPAIHKLENID
ncbi:MAG: FAD-dependent oxidoreductase [Methanobrevibacter sp.]|jgi:glycine/D-amino acid oxidase-like deaminating enzyme/nitrite reductase/ring-hydroxylating ferredoxin subunit|nr:FAD-dependent oxidoreductase [Candidatus Methanovirga basalitermitum]